MNSKTEFDTLVSRKIAGYTSAPLGEVVLTSCGLKDLNEGNVDKNFGIHGGIRRETFVDRGCDPCMKVAVQDLRAASNQRPTVTRVSRWTPP